MTILFACGEDIGFTTQGLCTIETATTTARRTAYARCGLKVGDTVASNADGDGWYGSFNSASNSFWFTVRRYAVNHTIASTTSKILSFLLGVNSKIEIRPTTTNALSGGVGIYKVTNAGVSTLLATASNGFSDTTLLKIDVNINYSASGFVRLYYGGTLVADTGTVDVTTDGATSLDRFAMGTHTRSANRYAIWSEPIVATEDTRSLSLATLEPNASGNAFTFDTGSFANVDEITVDDNDLITSATADQLAQFAVNNTRITGNPGVRAVGVYARAQKGGTGPANIQMNVRSGGLDHLSPSKALIASMQPVSHVFDTNPGTGGSWAYTDLTAAGFNIGVKSNT